MNLERLLREVDQRLLDRGEELRATVQDAIREAVARERRGAPPEPTLEGERERRVEAEEMGEVLEAIHRPASSELALTEAARQCARALQVDAVVIAAAEGEGALRVLTALGEASESLVGRLLSGPAAEACASSRNPTVVEDAQAAGGLACPLELPLRAWTAVPMRHEGQCVGLLVAGRRSAAGFTDEGLRRSRRLAFAAAAIVARHRHEEQLRRYALLLEAVVDLGQRVFRGEAEDRLLQTTLDGACRVGGCRGGLLVLQTPHGPTVMAACGDGLVGAVGRPAPASLAATVPRRLGAERVFDLAEALGVMLPSCPVHLVPLSTPERYVGCLVLLDEAGPSPRDLLVESFASRAALALRFGLAAGGGREP